MRLIEIEPQRKILAGHASDLESVFVLRKDQNGDYRLITVPIAVQEQALRSFLPADDSEAMELQQAIHETLRR